jgi:two-component system chemotaxis response regulator CheB
LAGRDIIVVGGSTGSVSVLARLTAELPPDLPASVFIVTHVPREGSNLAGVLAGGAALPVHPALDGQPIEKGQIYVAAPDRHLLLASQLIHLGRGPRENMARPAVDPLFRSAALVFGPRVIGVVLTGMLNDGASGLAAIKQRGGLAVVQHPLDAEAAEMPRAALEAVEADHVVRGDELAALLGRLAHQATSHTPLPPSPELELEVQIAASGPLGAGELSRIAEPSTLTCPHCQGVLSEISHSTPLRFRCQTGHAFTAEAVDHAQQKSVDEAVFVALRVMEERLSLVSRMAREARDQGRSALAELYEARAEEYGRYAATLREAAARSS